MGKKKATGKKGTTPKKGANKKNKPAKKKKGNSGGQPVYGNLINIPASTAKVKKIPPGGPYLDAVICARGSIPAPGTNETVTRVACIVEKASGDPLSFTNSYVPSSGATTWSFDPVGGVNPNDPNGTKYYFKLGISYQNSATLGTRIVRDSQQFTVSFQSTTDCGT